MRSRFKCPVFQLRKPLDNFDFSFQPSIDKRQIDELATMRFLENGTNVQIYTANNSTAQQWELTYLNNGYYTITSRASGKALDVAGASADAGANVQQYTPNGTNAQQWMLKDAGDGSAKPRPVTVTFDPNGGSVERRSMTVAYEDMFGNLPEPTRAGYTFDGWYTSAGGGVRMTANTVVFNTSDFTLYAHWTEEVHTHTRGGSFVSESHPHYKYYTCTTCGEVYTENSATYVSSCSICNPPKETQHTHARGSSFVSDSHPHYKYYTCTACGEVYTDNSTTYMSSCSTCNPPKETGNSNAASEGGGNQNTGRWGSWSGWSTSPVSASSTCEVETKQVMVSDSRTEYRYGRYVDGTGRNAGFCTATMAKLGYSGMTAQYSAWTTSRYPAKDKDWTCGNCGGSHTGVHHYSADGRAWWKEYVSPQSGNFFWEESRQTDAVYETQYRYRDWISG